MSEDTDRLMILNKEQLLARREAILALLGLTYKEWIAKEMNQGFEGTEWDYESEMDAIDFLLEGLNE